MKNLNVEELKVMLMVGKLSNRQKAYRVVARLRDHFCGFQEKDDVSFMHSFDKGFQLSARIGLDSIVYKSLRPVQVPGVIEYSSKYLN